MAFTDSEIARMRVELGYNVMSNSAVPYIQITNVFDQVIAQYALSDVSTTSVTTVSEPTAPTPATIVVASATGISAGCSLVVDVDSRREVVTVQNVSGSSVTAIFSKAHSGTYPVSVDSGETIVREILQQLADLNKTLSSRMSAAGIKKVDEIEFSDSKSAWLEFTNARDYLRDQLASALGIANRNKIRIPTTLEAY
jgi:hypothetical protein